MADKVLSFKELQKPALKLELPDENDTVIRVTDPSVDLLEELEEMLPEFDRVTRSGNKEAIKAIYDLAARLINCNRDFITVTGDELRTKYNMGLDFMQIFFAEYVDFVAEIYKRKN